MANVFDRDVVLEITAELIWRDMATWVDKLAILYTPVNPNGLIPAPFGSLASGPAGFYQNVGGMVWVPIAGGGALPLAGVLGIGNTTGGTDIVLSVGDSIIGAGAGDVVTFGATVPLIYSGATGRLEGSTTVVMTRAGIPATGLTEGAVFVSDGTGALTINHLYYRPPGGGVPIDLQAGGAVETLAATLVAGNTTGGTSIIVSTGDQINGQTSLVLSPNGGTGLAIVDLAAGGSLQTTSTGNARGTRAIDLQASRAIVSQVASGANSAISGGRDNTASGLDSFVPGGRANIASGQHASAMGLQSAALNRGELAYGAGQFDVGAIGQAQRAEIGWWGETVGAVTNELFTDGPFVASGRYVLADSSSVKFTIEVIGVDAAGATCGYKRSGVIKRLVGAATTAFVGTTVDEDTAADGAVAACNVTVSADAVNGALAVSVTGVLGLTIRWFATMTAAVVRTA